jgi:DNA-binding SARP family transcriptional activator/DNA-binding beta-propeller fold protein YncE
MVEFRILGPLEVVNHDRALALGGPKQRALLAILVLHRGEVLATDRLIDELWGERAPATAAKTVQVYVSNLRKALGHGLLVTKGRGYVLDVTAEQVDLDRLRALASQGHQALEDGDAPRASDRLREALALWRGPPLAEFAYEPFGRSETARLEDEYLAAVEDRVDADLALGRHATLIAELDALVCEHPFKERLHSQLMLALYRSGRQADALEHYQQTRRMLIDQLGIDPGPELRELERAILNQDPALQQPSRGSVRDRVPSRRRGPLTVVIIGAVLLLLAAVSAALINNHTARVAITTHPAGLMVAIAPATDRTVTAIPVGRAPGDIAVGGGSVWVLSNDDLTISQINPQTREVLNTFAAGAGPLRLAYGDGSLWVGSIAGRPLLNPDLGSLVRIDPTATSLPAQMITLPRRVLNTIYDDGNDATWAKKLAVGNGVVWVASSDGSVYRIDPGRGRIVKTIHGLHSGSVALDPTGVWALGADIDRGYISLISARTDSVITHMTVPSANIGGATVGDGALWFTGHDEGAHGAITGGIGQESLWRVGVGDTTHVNLGLSTGAPGIALGAGSVWVINPGADTVIRVDPVTLHVLKIIQLPGTPGGIAFDDGVVWVSITTAYTSSGGIAQPHPENLLR